MRHLQNLPDGQHMLVHQAGASAVSCFSAAPDGLLDDQVGVGVCVCVCACVCADF